MALLLIQEVQTAPTAQLEHTPLPVGLETCVNLALLLPSRKLSDTVVLYVCNCHIAHNSVCCHTSGIPVRLPARIARPVKAPAPQPRLALPAVRAITRTRPLTLTVIAALREDFRKYINSFQECSAVLIADP